MPLYVDIRSLDTLLTALNDDAIDITSLPERAVAAQQSVYLLEHPALVTRR